MDESEVFVQLMHPNNQMKWWKEFQKQNHNLQRKKFHWLLGVHREKDDINDFLFKFVSNCLESKTFYLESLNNTHVNTLWMDIFEHEIF